MPRQPTASEVRLNGISTCLTVTSNTLNILVDNVKISGLEAISNTTESLLKLVETIRQNRTECATLMEQANELLNAIIGVYINSDTAGDLAPAVLSQIAQFTQTLHKIHTFVEAQQSGSKIKKFFRHGELSILLKDCKAELQQGLQFFKINTSNIISKEIQKIQEEAHGRHQEVLDIIETVSGSDSASSISKIYSGSYTSSNSISLLPAEPKIFHGRESELADILELFSQGTPRIAILGAGGMGKTSLAVAVLHHSKVSMKFHPNRFFVACDTATSKVELANQIGAHLGLKPGNDLTQAVIKHLSSASSSLLILDNFETLWEPAEARKEIEEFLALLADITSLALMITMRGAERPSKVQWTRPFLPPLQRLAQDAAQKMFIDIADDRHSMEEVDQVLGLTDNMPLSINLLAHLVDAEGCIEILSRWEIEKTSLISEGHDRRSNLELSISLSLASPRITSMPRCRDLLGLLSILPEGLSDVELMQSNFQINNILGCKATLLRTALAYTDDHNRLKALVPIREYMRKLFPPADQMIRPLLRYFKELLQLYTVDGGKKSAVLSINRVASNFANIQNVLRNGLQQQYPDVTDCIYCACDFNRFSTLNGRGLTPLLDDIPDLLPHLGDTRLTVYYTTEVFRSRAQSVFTSETLIAQTLEHLNQLDDPDLKFRLSYIEWFLGKYSAGQVNATEGQRFAQISGDLHIEAQGLYTEALCLQALGDYGHCISQIKRARTLIDLCAEVHKLKSEYVEAHTLQNQILQEALAAHSPGMQELALASIAEIEVPMGASKTDIETKINASQAIAEATGDTRLTVWCNMIQADLSLREGDMSRLLFYRCINAGWGNFSEAVGYCFERLGDPSRWEESHHSISWTIVFLAYSVKTRKGLEIHKALQFMGDIFLRENDEATAISLFTLALEGFTLMDVHKSRADCMIRLGDICKNNGNLPKAMELWETAQPLFKCSSQAKQVQNINERLLEIGKDVKEQH
ncbi:hypothetical protein C8F04DRAFT_1230249 [Mycena alexandri]|uniref:Novel STAND NTPase 1 domain-containing protein n=1 Tax=Mycena alexandri TaxID=1745969 RepID=A0AAD6X9N5_9AGAR|nr:hypothetical protein C8F04DRAFT_1230249 [Mycena alexandri]